MGATAIAATSERPGVDLGALQALIGDCGGHFWINAEPGGEMELKIHLPLRSADTSKSAGMSAPPSGAQSAPGSKASGSNLTTLRSG